MNQRVHCLSRCVAMVVAAVLLTAQASGQTTATSAAEAAIRATAQEFVKSFDRHDAKALANQFAASGVYVDELGQRFEGREAIEQQYRALFQRAPEVKVRLEIDAIRLVNATTALEEGRLALTPQPGGEPRVMSAYTAVHTLLEGQWLISHVQDSRIEVPLPPAEQLLEDLGWLVGTWRAASDEAQVDAKAHWSGGGRYLTRTHVVSDSAQRASTEVEIIGVDPLTGEITSWSFASDGGRSAARWTPNELGWIVSSAGVTADGTETMATHTLVREDEDTLLWESKNRFLGDAPLPDIAKVVLERQQPEPTGEN